MAYIKYKYLLTDKIRQHKIKMMIANLLNIFKLTDKEKIVFMKVLGLGSQPASALARLLEQPRNTVRDILDRLTKLGLLVRTKKANTQYYSVETPQNIERFLEMRKKKTSDIFNQQIDLIKCFGEELQPHKYHLSRPKVTFYEGEDGLRRVYEDTLTSQETIRAYASLYEMYETLPDYFPEYFRRRAKKRIKIRAIFPHCRYALERQKHDKEEFRESRLVPQSKFHFTPEINIYDNKFIIISWKEKLAIMIESQEIADAMKMTFELAWITAGSFTQPAAPAKPHH